MKFFCEYCGNRIDADKDHKCNNCGASYKKNKEFIKLHEERKRNLEINNEYKHKVINHVFDTIKFSGFLMIVPIIIFVIVFALIVVGFMNMSNMEKGFNEFIGDVDSVFEEESKKVTAGFNEFAETKDYKVKVEKYETVEDKFREAGPGYELVKFHLIVENLTNEELMREDVNCIVDGVAQENNIYAGHSELPMLISRELAVKGTATFIVPIDATSYDIRYGDYVTIHIEK